MSPELAVVVLEGLVLGDTVLGFDLEDFYL